MSLDVKRMNEYITLDSGIFTAISENFPTEYASLFDTLVPTDLDVVFYSNYSERYAAPLVTNCDNDMVLLSRVIISLFEAKWLRVKDALEVEYAIDKPYNITTESETNRTFESDVTRNSTDREVIYGFNDSVNGSPDSQNTNNTSRTTENSENATREQSRYGNLGNIAYARLVQMELDLRQTQYLETVFNDLKRVTTLDIY